MLSVQKNIFPGKLFLNGCLLVVFITLFLLNFYSKTLFYRPGSLHLWRQADCLSITKNYYEEGMHFFSPRIHSLQAPGGKAVSEFPLINYSVAVLWKIFGEHEFIYRLLEYFIYLGAIIVLFNTLIRHYSQRILVFFMVSLLLTSPLLTYYSFNFLSDVPALSLAIVSFCCLFLFYRTRSLRYFYLSLGLGALAALLKASAILPVSLGAFFALASFLNLSSILKTPALKGHKILPAATVFIVFIAIYLWYSFAREYNSVYDGIFRLTTSPLWRMDRAEISANFESLTSRLLPEFLNRPMLILFFCGLFYILFRFRRLDNFLKWCFVISLFFVCSYIVFFFQVFSVHDYYLVNLFIFPVICFFCFLDLASKESFRSPVYLKILLVLIFVSNAFFAAASYRLKVIMKDNMIQWYPFITGEEKKSYEYSLWEFNKTMAPVRDLKPVLRQLGINRNDAVLSLTDGGPNVALYFMDQKGFVLIWERVRQDTSYLERFMNRDMDYLVLNNPELKKERSFEKIQQHLVSIYEKPPIQIFKLK